MTADPCISCGGYDKPQDENHLCDNCAHYERPDCADYADREED